MITFLPLQEETNVQELIHSTFDVDLPLSGSWGYSQEKATIINVLRDNTPLAQLQYMVTSIRANLEMNITQEQQNRYSGINANEKQRETIKYNDKVYEKVTYEITGIKEDIYNAFIKEYKEGYDDQSLDLDDHFKRRKEATLTREVIHYFDISNIQQP
ncbi:MAG: Unknown protein [uncultured Sulfurovum sp.]|uniref:Uncharacterized protein n=1 Tax=uncultured Sulfurovum sp. TaxID=269237 RepID=A0A6S6T4S2_9BACT|nr:MAG: Unknown protein [uncultured Sulfurovum sp.]